MKHVLTVTHCAMAIAVQLLWAAMMTQVENRVAPAIVLAVGITVLPVIIATRVSWSAGYRAGRESLTPTVQRPEA